MKALLDAFFGAKNSETIKSQSAKTSKTRKTSVIQPKPHRATSIVFDDDACEAVKAIDEKRFLVSKDAIPTLPLAKCDTAKCNCKYMHYDDRREHDEDRRLPWSLATELYEKSGNPNRRQRRRGRRKTDWA